MDTANRKISRMYKEVYVRDFVSDFLGIQRGIKITRMDIISGINYHIKYNFDLYRKGCDGDSFRVINALQAFFYRCSSCTTKCLNIPPIIRYRDILKYLMLEGAVIPQY